MKILEFKKPEAPTEQLRGRARCSGCRHEWEAIAPVGSVMLECPGCHTMKGLYVYPVADGVGERWVCNCGCDLFYVKQDGYQCYICGVFQTF